MFFNLTLLNKVNTQIEKASPSSFKIGFLNLPVYKVYIGCLPSSSTNISALYVH